MHPDMNPLSKEEKARIKFAVQAVIADEYEKRLLKIESSISLLRKAVKAILYQMQIDNIYKV